MLNNEDKEAIQKYYPRMTTYRFLKKFDLQRSDVKSYVKKHKIEKLQKTEFVCCDCLENEVYCTTGTGICKVCLLKKVANYNTIHKVILPVKTPSIVTRFFKLVMEKVNASSVM